MHIVFMAVPEHGHLNPGLPLVTELVARGHRVSYAITEKFADHVAAAGATPSLYTTTFPERMPEDGEAGTRMFVDEFRSATPQIEALYDNDRPDVIVCDIGAFQGTVLADRWGVPVVQLSASYIAIPGSDADDFPKFVAENGIPDALLTPRPCLVAMPRSFQFDAPTIDGTFTFVGPMGTPEPWTAPDDRPVLLISLGSSYTDRPDFFRDCLTAYADNGWHVELAIGNFVDPADLGPVPSNFTVSRWVPQASILTRANAFITHAGMGGVMEALAQGVPLIAVPQAVDQLLTGPRIEELGLGQHIPRDEVTVERLRAALHHVSTDEKIAANLDAIRREILASGGVQRAADIVESQVEG
ncbi:nucleotide disphospho-sugar-binding domain-containing protein [Kutzneria sp. CA-103260]|uniref:nucleotide disphospho-sugar-binding domain-containing protein n=1 Tax=Kutzneria sp. CA-103260 TaxID=2802641 RepID=UPI001BAD9792|nr:nucleotide disphospho-sugar-binding domain-containing protein [Kutzneria sp. CA-103260]QUQ72163.1 macrolide-inactivating glycosyltransferase [Kutzneria sp. CA-103260]